MSQDTHSFPPKPLIPRVLSATELYDMLMARIEPELMSGRIEEMNAILAAASPQEKAQRAERYSKAFAAYEVQLKKYQEEWNAKLRNFKRLAIAYLEGKERMNGESAHLSALESSLSA